METSRKPPDFQIQYGPVPSQAQHMSDARVLLGPDLSQMATKAAKAAGIEFQAITIAPEIDASNDPAIFFTYVIPEGAAVSGEARSRLLAELRDRLLSAGRAEYPYVKLASA